MDTAGKAAAQKFRASCRHEWAALHGKSKYVYARYLPVDKVEEILGGLFDRVGVGVQMSRAFRRDELAVVGTEAQRAVALPNQVEKCVRRPASKTFAFKRACTTTNSTL